jgi:hypothetical protein
MPFYDTNPNFRAQPFEEPVQTYKVEQEMKRQAYMAQQQERFGGPQVSAKPMDLASVLQTYENLLGGLIDQIEALEHRLSPLLLDYSNGPVETEKDSSSSTGSPVTTRVHQLNSTLRMAVERVARVTQSVNL